MPARRPEAHEVVSTIMSTRLPAVPNMIELLCNAKRNESIRSENQSLRSENDTMRSENHSLRSEVNTLQTQIQKLSAIPPHQLQLPQSESQVGMHCKNVYCIPGISGELARSGLHEHEPVMAITCITK